MWRKAQKPARCILLLTVTFATAEQSWSKVTSFPNAGNYVQDPDAAAKVAGVRGIFRSTDAGQTWVRIVDDQHQWGRAGETALTGDPRIFGRVYVGTNGRGIIYGDAP
ncbi:MAG TPA: hypothetical protein VFS76_01250 [Pyrinomonadaceae bacterium]|nr:hypothetical protein [Pyrinomonadaceae bacterium]